MTTYKELIKNIDLLINVREMRIRNCRDKKSVKTYVKSFRNMLKTFNIKYKQEGDAIAFTYKDEIIYNCHKIIIVENLEEAATVIIDFLLNCIYRTDNVYNDFYIKTYIDLCFNRLNLKDFKTYIENIDKNLMRALDFTDFNNFLESSERYIIIDKYCMFFIYDIKTNNIHSEAFKTRSTALRFLNQFWETFTNEKNDVYIDDQIKKIISKLIKEKKQ